MNNRDDVIYFSVIPGNFVDNRDFVQKRSVRKDFPTKGDVSIVYYSITHDKMKPKGKLFLLNNLFVNYKL